MSGSAGGRQTAIAGYASLFRVGDLAGDIVAPGAFAASLARRGARRLGMLHQHAASAPVGVWDHAAEDARGLFLRGRIIEHSLAAAHAAGLVRAGVLDGLSIGFAARAATRDPASGLRVLTEIDLFEVSLVSFPMLPAARLVVVSPRTNTRAA